MTGNEDLVIILIIVAVLSVFRLVLSTAYVIDGCELVWHRALPLRDADNPAPPQMFVISDHTFNDGSSPVVRSTSRAR